MRRIFFCAALGAVSVVAAPPAAGAATPDGSGPWADFVVSAQQGPNSVGGPVIASRSNPAAALGPAEANTVDTNFFSLGFGGELTLGFENDICNGPGQDLDLTLVEATNEPYPPELVDVYVSEDGVAYTLAATAVDKDAAVSLPDSVPVAHFVRLVDVTDVTLFQEFRTPADGYDVDGVTALNTSCVATGRMTGGGSVFTAAGDRVTHGFEIRCTPSGSDSIQVNWGGNRFHLEAITGALCSDDPTIGPLPPHSGFDTYRGEGTGSYNGVGGATVRWTFTDAGEPGRTDTATIVVEDGNGDTVLSVGPVKVQHGNHQAHRGA